MKSVELPCLGKFECPDCGLEIPAWRSSGMSQLCPHFYCTECNNVIVREEDQRLTHNDQTPEILEKIASSLPICGCGGKFMPGTNPKCPSCKHQFPHRLSPLLRLTDPNVILVDGAIMYGDNGPKYRVVIASV